MHTVSETNKNEMYPSTEPDSWWPSSAFINYFVVLDAYTFKPVAYSPVLLRFEDADIQISEQNGSLTPRLGSVNTNTYPRVTCACTEQDICPLWHSPNEALALMGQQISSVKLLLNGALQLKFQEATLTLKLEDNHITAQVEASLPVDS